ncbi:MAG: hypothetical protein P9M08_07640 [Candidatus Erginobacter occultus]|nr:hypothetical protein [Candidatus Erginobacter occultus]
MEWSWRLRETEDPDIWAIELGPMNLLTEELTPRAVYKWSRDSQQYVGPEGGDDLPFKRARAEREWPPQGYESFIANQRKQEE